MLSQSFPHKWFHQYTVTGTHSTDHLLKTHGICIYSYLQSSDAWNVYKLKFLGKTRRLTLKLNAEGLKTSNYIGRWYNIRNTMFHLVCNTTALYALNIGLYISFKGLKQFRGSTLNTECCLSLRWSLAWYMTQESRGVQLTTDCPLAHRDKD